MVYWNILLLAGFSFLVVYGGHLYGAFLCQVILFVPQSWPLIQKKIIKCPIKACFFGMRWFLCLNCVYYVPFLSRSLWTWVHCLVWVCIVFILQYDSPLRKCLYMYVISGCCTCTCVRGNHAVVHAEWVYNDMILRTGVLTLLAPCCIRIQANPYN